MLRRVLIAAGMIILGFLLQTTIFKSEFLTFGLVSPNLLLVITFIFGFMRGRKSGIIIGFFCGLLIDLYSDVIGINALLFMVVGYVNGWFNKIFYDEDIALPLGLLVGSEFLYNTMFYFFRFLLRGDFNYFYYLVHVILPETIYTVLITVFVYRLILKLNRKLERYERRRTGKFV